MTKRKTRRMEIYDEIMDKLADLTIATRSAYFALDSLYDTLKKLDEDEDGYARQARIARELREAGL